MIELRRGDCREILIVRFKDGEIGAIVTDPPYEIEFMSRKWDGSGIAFDPELWALVHRKLRPGGIVKVFGAPRTFHRLCRALAKVGFVGIDLEGWAYGQGFPKSKDISKAIDEELGVLSQRQVIGVKPGNEEFAGKGIASVQSMVTGTLGGEGGFARPWMSDPEAVQRYHAQTEPVSPEARRFEHYGTALKPGWEPFVVARKAA